ncbi:MAG: bifunctional hexulose-6-phosphate synthase/ribonuclease regulator, partial [Planctomycetota bacterium]|nr:bifunctional hexulose-6-phosphate synthase/ribonuclease regulator [Planctomycetota bacterium]
TAALRQALRERRSIASALYLRGSSEGEVADILRRVSTANLSDALHRQPGLRGIVSRTPGRKCVGQAVTVRVAPGDWSKVVQAIDRAAAGAAIVVDAGGSPPAVWGELATRSALQKGIAGVIIDGAVRDTDVAAALGLPIFSRHVCPDAGEPKGFGEIDSLIYVSGQAVRPGDWVVADDDGVMILPRGLAVEYANRALDVLETENRLRAEIEAGSTLGRVANLLRWEKH